MEDELEFSALLRQSGVDLSSRLMWIFLLLALSAAFLYMLVSIVKVYYTWPVVMHVRTDATNSARFPAVTICNQNAFRYNSQGFICFIPASPSCINCTIYWGQCICIALFISKQAKYDFYRE